MLNHIVLQGRLTKAPELRTTQNGTAVVSFTLANDTDFGEKHTDFVECVAWRQTAEFVSKYFQKGQMAIVSGRLESRKWQDRDGNNRTSWDVQVDRVYFGESKRQDGYSAPDITPPTLTEVDDDGELPF